MHKIKHVCFDLDGTLIDSYQTIYNTTIKTLHHLKIEEPLTESEFQKRIGHHFIHIFNDLAIPVPDIEEFIDIYKSYYFDFIDSSVLYPGIPEVLNELKHNEIKISLLTTKGQDQADKIIDHFDLRKFFNYVMGRRPDMEIKPSPQSLHFICNELMIEEYRTIIVGDTEIDIHCGKNAGAYSCAVTYGYRSEEFLKAENPDFILHDINGILKIIKDFKEISS
ncbi:MAG TPA: HAD family hydrolase [Ignavibacteriaceae bacterium]|nr:HAD family hydrolase [Ignavibacteriaceae bacterium]